MGIEQVGLIALGAGLGALLVWGFLRTRRPAAQASDAVDEGGPRQILGDPKSMPAGSIAIFVAGLLLAGFTILYTSYRAPADSVHVDPTLAQSTGNADQQLADVDTMIGRLEQKLAANPEDGEGHRMLGWAYLMTDRPTEALAPYKRALALLPQDAASRSGYAEALIAIDDGTVSDEAMAQVRQALALDPGDHRARYFAARYDLQNGRKKSALDSWIALADELPADAAWQPELRRDIQTVAAELGIDVSDRLAVTTQPASAPSLPVLDSATIAAADRLSQTERERMIDDMVNRLAARLKTQPNDPEGWGRLVRSRMVRGETARAAADLAEGRRALAKNPEGLSSLNAVASELGVP